MNLLLLNILRNGGGGSPTPTFEWNDIPYATFTPEQTVTYGGTSSGNITSGVIGTNTLIAVDGLWDRLVGNGVSGADEDNAIKVVNADADVRIGNAAGAYATSDKCIKSLNNANYWEFWGKSPTEPLWLRDNDDGGLNWEAIAGDGVTIKGYNLVMENMGWGSVFMNTGDNTKKYKKVYLQAIRNKGLVTEGEGLTYVGSTNKTTYSVFDEFTIKDGVSMDRGSDGAQFNSHKLLTVDGITIANVGRQSPPVGGQENLLQAQNTQGFIMNSVFDSGYRFLVSCGHGLIQFNNYYRWDANTGQEQSIVTEYGASTQWVANSRLPRWYIECDFAPDASTNLFTVHEDKCDIILYNCNLTSNVSGAFTDSRSDTGTHSLLNINSTTGATIPEPAYLSTDLNSPDFGKVIDTYHYGKARGNLTKDSRKRSIPNFDVVSITAPSGITVPEGTSFASLNLPKVVTVLIEESITVHLPITWVQGAYDPDVQDIYTLTGTLDLPDWYIIKNPLSVQTTIDVEVVEPSFNPFLESDIVAGFDPAGAVADLAAGTPFWTNQGSGDNAAQSTATAVPTSVTEASFRSGYGVQFVKASSQGLGYGTGTVTTPFETWIEFRTPASFTGFSTGTLLANGTTPRIDINISGTNNLRLNGTVTGITLAASTTYVIRVVSDGASSTVTVNNGTPVSVSIGASSGSSTPKIGMAYAATSYYDGLIGDIFQFENVKDSTFVSNMWTWFGF